MPKAIYISNSMSDLSTRLSATNLVKEDDFTIENASPFVSISTHRQKEWFFYKPQNQ